MVAARKLPAPLTVPVAGLDPDDALFDALYEIAKSAPVRAVDNGIGRFEAWGRTCTDTALALEVSDVPEQLVLTGLRADDTPAEKSEAEVEREADWHRATVTGTVRVRARLVERVGDVATYAIEAAS